MGKKSDFKEITKIQEPEEKKEDIQIKPREKTKIPKDVSQAILKKVFKNILIAICIILYFVLLNMASVKMKEERLIVDLKIFSGGFLFLGIFFLEQAYKKNDGAKATHGIEAIILSAHTLSIMHVITVYRYDFHLYLLVSSYIFAIYFVLKSIVIYTRGKQEYLESLSDITEILQTEPLKKEALKREAKVKNKIVEQENKKIANKAESKQDKKTEKIESKSIKPKKSEVHTSKNSAKINKTTPTARSKTGKVKSATKRTLETSTNKIQKNEAKNKK